MKTTHQRDLEALEKKLDSFNASVRKDSLCALAQMAEEGLILLPAQREIANLHSHTFFSYNGYGFSPTHIAWLGRKLGAKFMGIVDFDILDGVDEFLEACEIVKVCGSAGMETRVFVPEYADREINSPGEPGVSYHMGIGFTHSQTPGKASDLLDEIRNRSQQRNREMLNRINQYLDPLVVNYERDVLPATPNNNATERHMLDKIIEKSFSQIDDPVDFWSHKLKMSTVAIQQQVKNKQSFSNLVRKKLMKRGGIGYILPTQESFPLINQIHEVITSCGAIPCIAWLDGTSEVEKDIENLMDLMIEKGAGAINIIPDRNWNIQNAEIKSVKLSNLFSVVAAAKDHHLPVHVGTEMNSHGQKLIDNFDVPELEPVRDEFIEGAYFIYGHTRMQRYWNMGWQSKWVKGHFRDRKSRNDFFREVGHIFPPGIPPINMIDKITPEMKPEEVIASIKQSIGDDQI